MKISQKTFFLGREREDFMWLCCLLNKMTELGMPKTVKIPWKET